MEEEAGSAGEMNCETVEDELRRNLESFTERDQKDAGQGSHQQSYYGDCFFRGPRMGCGWAG